MLVIMCDNESSNVTFVQLAVHTSYMTLVYDSINSRFCRAANVIFYVIFTLFFS